MTSDPLEDVLHLEDRYYREGYQQGLDDGARAGHAEGRTFGLEKGLEKFLEGGRLAGRAVVWANRLPRRQDVTPENLPHRKDDDKPTVADASQPNSSSRPKRCELPPLPENTRIERNVRALYALVEPGTLSTENTDEAVQDFDSRMKRAQGKAKIIERALS
ncbi:hypothetical protein CDD80_4268 [Ophiocordyceps camponoti-rufipedis]|uniref:Essential protein Yae1 N-terminal domain-containing protein n=1 Tax=Ophiocordyceps camponoti-rufipedis TaxID=2004952 RepID=A0A2C5Z0S9_9HYPO|nr:hypothetical protein CDD80_4268 [Ophiocordyceps camponoti-rufipedis]